MTFSIQTITAITEVVTGGSAGASAASIGVYRTGPELERFFGALDLELCIGRASRLPSVRDLLLEVNKRPDGELKIVAILEAVTDARDYVEGHDRLTAVVEYLNKRLAFDGFQLREIGGVHKVLRVATNTVAAAALHKAADELDLDSVQRDFDQALAEADSNPGGAITAACSTVESVCKCLLDEMKQEYPAKQDIRGLVAEVGRYLNLSPGRRDLPSGFEQDIRQILGGLSSVTGGIGALRTHAGDAHGRGKIRVIVDARIARLAIHAATTVSLFLIETWQRSNQNGIQGSKQ